MNPDFQLDFTHHPNVGRFIITIKPEKSFVKRPVAWKNNKRPARANVASKIASTSKIPPTKVNNTDENAPPTKKSRTTQKRAKQVELEAEENERKMEEQRKIEAELQRLRQVVSTHNETSETPIALDPRNLEQLLHVAAAVFLSDSSNSAPSRNLANLLAADPPPPPSPRRLQITPQKRSSNPHDDVSPGSQFDELDSSEAGDNDRFRRNRSEDIEEEEELSEEDSSDVDDGLWLTGLVRGELGNHYRSRRGDEEDSDDDWLVRGV